MTSNQRILSPSVNNLTEFRWSPTYSVQALEIEMGNGSIHVIFFLLFTAATTNHRVGSHLLKAHQGEKKTVSLEVPFNRQKSDILNDYILEKKKAVQQKPVTKKDFLTPAKPLNFENLKSMWKSLGRTNSVHGTLRLKELEKRIKDFKLKANPRLRLQVRNDFPPASNNAVEKRKTRKEEIENLVNNARLKLTALKNNYSTYGESRLEAPTFTVASRTTAVSDKNRVEAYTTAVPAIVVGHSTTTSSDLSQTENKDAITFAMDKLKNKQQQAVQKIKDRINTAKVKGMLEEGGLKTDNNDIPK